MDGTPEKRRRHISNRRDLRESNREPGRQTRQSTREPSFGYREGCEWRSCAYFEKRRKARLEKRVSSLQKKNHSLGAMERSDKKDISTRSDLKENVQEEEVMDPILRYTGEV